jgi:hypothetical protein
MKHFAGIAQVERRPTRPEMPVSSPDPRSIVLQAIAAGLQLNRVAYAAGRRDGEEGARFRPLDFDAFSYACGFFRGKQFPKRGDAHAI